VTPAVPATVADLVDVGTESLRIASDSPRLDAELLLSHAISSSRTRLLLSPEARPTAAQLEAFSALIARRARGEPVAYLLGTQDFWTLTLTVTPAVLVPRPETELVVERALGHLKSMSPASLLDLATGSGAIALAVASERPDAAVTATDLSPDALQVAKNNAARLGLDRVRFLQGSWYGPVGNERFNVITGNPPYIAAGDPDLSPAVFEHEPRLALFADDDGFAALREIIQGAPIRLEAGGWLVLEHGWKQASAVRNLLEQAGFRHVRSHADLAGRERVTEGQWPD